MAQYKVPQDIEVEDRIVGPLSLKQFIFAIFFFACVWFGWTLFRIQPLMALPLIPLIVIFGILAFVQRKDQPVEVYLASLLRFMMVPRVKRWDQDGLVETVHVVAPKRIEKVLTDKRDRSEVGSRLKDLSQLMDTRGWASRDYALNQPDGTRVSQFTSEDRLINIAELPQVQHIADVSSVKVADDPLEPSSPTGSHMDNFMQQSQQQHQQQIVEEMQQAKTSPAPAPVSASGPTPSQVAEDHAVDLDISHDSQTTSVTDEPDPAIISLSKEDELKVSDIARQAESFKKEGEINSGEGEISLH